MKASDVMVTSVITVGPETGERDAARILLASRISAAPVVGERGELFGVVSEGDFMRRSETNPERRRSQWLDLFASKETLAGEFVKAHACKVADVMTRDVITAATDASLGEAAAPLEKTFIKRVPIVKDVKIVDIVSRANLLQAFASASKKIDVTSSADDGRICESVIARLTAQKWADPWPPNVIVQDGAVELCGLVDSAGEKAAIRVTAEETDGVRAVTDNMIVRPLVFGDY